MKSIIYGSLNSSYDGDEAIITVSVEDGNATSNMLFVFTIENNQPELLESFEFPEYANLANAFVAHGELIIETFKKDGLDAEGCPSVVEITNYQWQKNKFVMQGEPQKAFNNYVERMKRNKK